MRAPTTASPEALLDRYRALRPLVLCLRHRGLPASAAVVSIASRGGTTTKTAVDHTLAVLDALPRLTKEECEALLAFRQAREHATEAMCCS